MLLEKKIPPRKKTKSVLYCYKAISSQWEWSVTLSIQCENNTKLGLLEVFSRRKNYLFLHSMIYQQKNLIFFVLLSLVF